MGPIQILFGTESGNAEMVAEVGIAIFITSTYGDGELPMTTAPFHEALVAAKPDLGSLRFGAFGLGDRTYETYNNAITVLASTLTELGATQLGDIGRHDASGAESYTDIAVAWVNQLLETEEINEGEAWS